MNYNKNLKFILFIKKKLNENYLYYNKSFEFVFFEFTLFFNYKTKFIIIYNCINI